MTYVFSLTEQLHISLGQGYSTFSKHKKYNEMISLMPCSAINLLTFKCLQNLAPIYLQDLLHPYEPKRDLRSADKGYLRETKTRTVAGDRAFCNAAPTLWKKLPDNVRNQESLESFKRELKTSLFEQAFNIKNNH